MVKNERVSPCFNGILQNSLIYRTSWRITFPRKFYSTPELSLERPEKRYFKMDQGKK